MNQTEQLIIMPIYKNNLEVTIRQDTKEAIGLIDHDISDTFPIQKFKIGQSIILFKESKKEKKLHIFFFQITKTTPSQCKNQLLQVDKQQNNYNIMIKNNYPTYIVVKDYKNEMSSEYPIQLDSIIRLGRVYLFIQNLIIFLENIMQLRSELQTCKQTMHKHLQKYIKNSQQNLKNIVIDDNQTEDNQKNPYIQQTYADAKVIQKQCILIRKHNLAQSQNGIFIYLSISIKKGQKHLNVRFFNIKENTLIYLLQKDLICNIYFYKYECQYYLRTQIEIRTYVMKCTLYTTYCKIALRLYFQSFKKYYIGSSFYL
ncbi:hypothetical protein pb186bvf_013818 [Paramecium bursaria]